MQLGKIERKGREGANKLDCIYVYFEVRTCFNFGHMAKKVFLVFIYDNTIKWLEALMTPVFQDFWDYGICMILALFQWLEVKFCPYCQTRIFIDFYVNKIDGQRIMNDTTFSRFSGSEKTILVLFLGSKVKFLLNCQTFIF